MSDNITSRPPLSRRADRLHVVLVQFDSVAHEPIEVGRLKKPTVPADIAPAEVVSYDQQNVRLRRNRRVRGN
jgi:hypothetical protein